MSKSHSAEASSLPDLRKEINDGKSYEKIGTIERQHYENDYQRMSTQVHVVGSETDKNNSKHDMNSDQVSKPQDLTIRIRKETPKLPRYVILPLTQKDQIKELNIKDSSYQDLPLEIDLYEDLPDSPAPLMKKDEHTADESNDYEKLKIKNAGNKQNKWVKRTKVSIFRMGKKAKLIAGTVTVAIVIALTIIVSLCYGFFANASFKSSPHNTVDPTATVHFQPEPFLVSSIIHPAHTRSPHNTVDPTATVHFQTKPLLVSSIIHPAHTRSPPKAIDSKTTVHSPPKPLVVPIIHPTPVVTFNICLEHQRVITLSVLKNKLLASCSNNSSNYSIIHITNLINRTKSAISFRDIIIDATWTPHGNIACALDTGYLLLLTDAGRLLSSVTVEQCGYFSTSRNETYFSDMTSVWAQLYTDTGNWTEIFGPLHWKRSILQAIKVETSQFIEYWVIEVDELEVTSSYVYTKSQHNPEDFERSPLVANFETDSQNVVGCRYLSYDGYKSVFCLSLECGDIFVFSTDSKTLKLRLTFPEEDFVEVMSIDSAQSLLYVGQKYGGVYAYNLTSLMEPY